MRITLQVWCTVLVAVLALAGCRGAAVVDADQQNAQVQQSAENTVPFHASLINTIEVVPPFPPPIINAIFEGPGKGSPFGPFTFIGISQVDVTVFPAAQTTDLVLTFRNGHELYMTSAGISFEDPPGTLVFSGDFTITGGTGHFSNATGSGTYAGTADAVAGVGQSEWNGVISGFGGPGN